MKEHRLIFPLKDIDRAANEFLSITEGYKHFAFYGSMGAGKTTFITSVCKVLGCDDLVSSPSFAIINEYSSKKGESIFHFDFYRIKTPVELLDIGFDEYCDANSICFIEWPEKGESIIPDDFIWLNLEEQEDGKRLLSFKL